MAGPSVNSPKSFLKPHRTRPRMVLRGRAIHITIISSNFLHGLSFGVKLGVFSCRFGTVSPDIYRKIKDRKSVGKGKSVSVRVDLGGRRIVKKKTKTKKKD